jgi:GNAT superfamily N-acetyltransferase
MADVVAGGHRLTLRPGGPDDYAAFARLFLELGVSEPPPPPEVWAAELAPLSLILEGPQGPLAYAVTDVMGEVGFVGQLVVDAGARGQGVGRRLMEALVERFRERGCRRWALNVKRDNVVALGLSSSVGLWPARAAFSLRGCRAVVEAVPAAPPGVVVVPAVEPEWEALTAAFRLMPHKLERLAKRGSHQLLRLARVGEAEPLRLGMMDLRLGGVLSPFFASTLGHARALMEEASRRTGSIVLKLRKAVRRREATCGFDRSSSPATSPTKR